MPVKEIDINTGKIQGYGICKKKRYNISFLGGPTTPTNSKWKFKKNINDIKKGSKGKVPLCVYY